MRLIDADAVIARIAGQMSYEIEVETGNETDCVDLAEELLNDIPSIDIVRCGECKYASDNKVYGCMLNHFNDNDYDYHRMYADDFCSYGEREGK